MQQLKAIAAATATAKATTTEAKCEIETEAKAEAERDIETETVTETDVHAIPTSTLHSGKEPIGHRAQNTGVQGHERLRNTDSEFAIRKNKINNCAIATAAGEQQMEPYSGVLYYYPRWS